MQYSLSSLSEKSFGFFFAKVCTLIMNSHIPFKSSLWQAALYELCEEKTEWKRHPEASAVTSIIITDVTCRLNWMVSPLEKHPHAAGEGVTDVQIIVAHTLYGVYKQCFCRYFATKGTQLSPMSLILSIYASVSQNGSPTSFHRLSNQQNRMLTCELILLNKENKLWWET